MRVIHPMFRCPSCHEKTISLLGKVAASDASYPAICPRCGKGAVANHARWSWLAWPDIPAYLTIGAVWLVTHSWVRAFGVTALVFCLLIVAHLLVLPLQPDADPADYPESIGVVAGARRGDLPRAVYVAFILSALGALAFVAYGLVGELR